MICGPLRPSLGTLRSVIRRVPLPLPEVGVVLNCSTPTVREPATLHIFVLTDDETGTERQSHLIKFEKSQKINISKTNHRQHNHHVQLRNHLPK